MISASSDRGRLDMLEQQNRVLSHVSLSWFQPDSANFRENSDEIKLKM